MWLKSRAEVPTLRKPRRDGAASVFMLPAKNSKGQRWANPPNAERWASPPVAEGGAIFRVIGTPASPAVVCSESRPARAAAGILALPWSVVGEEAVVVDAMGSFRVNLSKISESYCRDIVLVRMPAFARAFAAAKARLIRGGIRCAFVLCAAVLVADNPAPPELRDVDSYQVYSIVAINAARISLPEPAKGYSIKELTSGGRNFIDQCFAKSYVSKFEAAYANYSQNNEKPVRLVREFTLPTYELVTQTEVDELDKGPGPFWLLFSHKCPKSSGLLTFSRIGFSHGKTKAVVSVRFECGGMCVNDTDYLMRKIGGRWRILRAQSGCGGVS